MSPYSPNRLRVLWCVERRGQFQCQIITAAIDKQPHGHELRVFVGDEAEDNLLHSEVAQFDLSRRSSAAMTTALKWGEQAAT